MTPARAFGFASLLYGVAVGLGSHWLDPAPGWTAEAIALALFAGALGLAQIRFSTTYPHDRLGACNLVTQGRAAAVAVLAVAVVTPGIMVEMPITIFAIAAVTLAMDGVDGILARRSGLSSDFGAQFDMEVDAALGACLALILIRVAHIDGGHIDGTLSAVSLAVLGFSRYAFLLAALVWPWLNAPLPQRLSRKTICVVQIATLAGMLLPGVGNVAPVALPVAAGLLLWSFGRDILWLANQR